MMKKKSFSKSSTGVQETQGEDKEGAGMRVRSYSAIKLCYIRTANKIV